jgi:hypothetical protein|tara:strand:+ start:632 stop:844 length:213 start_codon:yes stop_codon:yes gene_type:complete
MEINEKTQQVMFYKDLESLIQRYYDEFDMSYESILGVLVRRIVVTVLDDVASELEEEIGEDGDEFTEDDD